MSTNRTRVVLYLDAPTHGQIGRLAAIDRLPPSRYIRRLIERHTSGETALAERFARKIDFVHIGLDALLQAQPWKPNLHQIVRDAHRNGAAGGADV